MWVPVLTLVVLPTVWATALNASDLCGTWNEETCNSASCGGGKWQKAAYAFTGDWRGNYYSFVTHEFGNPHCKIYQQARWDMLTVTLQGNYYLTDSDAYNYQWTNIVFTPTHITVFTPDDNSFNATYTFPDGTCDSPVDYLNRNCPCGDWWRYGEERTIYFDECEAGSCPVFRNVKQYAKVQLYTGHDHETSWLGLTQPTTTLEHDSIQTPVSSYNLWNQFGCAPTKAMKNCQEDPKRCILDPRPEQKHREDQLNEIGEDRWWEYSGWFRQFFWPRPPVQALGAGGEENKEEENKEEEREIDCQQEENKDHADCVQDDSSSSSSITLNASSMKMDSESDDTFTEITDLLIYVGVGAAATVLSVAIGWYFCIQSLAKAPEATSDYNAINDRVVN